MQKFRSFTFEFFVIIDAARQQNVINQENTSDFTAEQWKLLQHYREYIAKLDFWLEQIYDTFLDETPFILSSFPTCLDHIFYHEILSLMIVSGLGANSTTELVTNAGGQEENEES